MYTVEVNNVSVYFNLSTQKLDSVKDYFIARIKNQIRMEPFWAVKNVSFKLKKGESLGIMGYNGSGKSTLLKTIAGVIRPNEGEVRKNGKVAPMIELGAGFDPKLTARENVFLNGALLGYNREYMRGKMAGIFEFAELEEFADVPVQKYSSGMVTRLGFAIATMNTADILILDEVLSVGDYKFQAKSLARTREMVDSGTTVLFVSHSAEQVMSICNRAIWLDHGQIVMEGDPAAVGEAYGDLVMDSDGQLVGRMTKDTKDQNRKKNSNRQTAASADTAEADAQG